jgi:GDP-L-fucose synthase
MSYALSGKRVWVAGHRGMVGAGLVRQLEKENCTVLTVDRDEVDLRDAGAVAAWVKASKPHAVVLAAAKVGGIVANDTYPAQFLFDNLAIETAIIHASHQGGVEKLLFLGSSCIYPKFAPQPITEDALLTGPLEPTNEWYAIAKIAGVKLCQAYRKEYGHDYISAMPTNLYGPGDNFNLQASHVIPAMMRKAHEAKLGRSPSMTIWGSGTPRREFLHVDDCAGALIFLLKNYSGESHINVGYGDDVTIDELARKVMAAVGYSGKLEHDTSKPDGTPRKLMSSARLTAMGWTPQISLEKGLAETYAWFLRQEKGALRA